MYFTSKSSVFHRERNGGQGDPAKDETLVLFREIGAHDQGPSNKSKSQKDSPQGGRTLLFGAFSGFEFSPKKTSLA